MCKINFVSEFNCFMRYAKNHSLSGRERNLWIALFYIANDRANYNAATRDYEWPDEFFPVTIGELNLHSNLDKKSIEAIRNQLKQRGLIDFEKGKGNVKPAKYKINYLSLDVGYKIVPNNPPNIPPKNTPNTPPDSSPNTPAIYKDIDIGVGSGENETKIIHDADDPAHAGGENAIDEFLDWNGQNVDAFYGVDETMKQQAQAITNRLFAIYGNRAPTSADRNYVILETKEYSMESGTHHLSGDRIKLLAYCFEQAFLKDCPGNWRYIQGCLRNLAARGIQTLEDIEDYDAGRLGFEV